MNQLLDALYNLLSFLTEDAMANNYYVNKLPDSILAKMNELCDELGKWLDENK